MRRGLPISFVLIEVSKASITSLSAFSLHDVHIENNGEKRSAQIYPGAEPYMCKGHVTIQIYVAHPVPLSLPCVNVQQ